VFVIFGASHAQKSSLKSSLSRNNALTALLLCRSRIGTPQVHSFANVSFLSRLLVEEERVEHRAQEVRSKPALLHQTRKDVVSLPFKGFTITPFSLASSLAPKSTDTTTILLPNSMLLTLFRAVRRFQCSCGLRIVGQIKVGGYFSRLKLLPAGHGGAY